MCRMAVYRGPAIPLKQVIYSPSHNFIRLAQKPREMVAAPLNGDGFGLGWYNQSLSSEPALITSEKPLWHDINLPRISDKILSDTIFMHVRAASPGLPVHQANSHPFQWENLLFMHNGVVSDFRKGFLRALRERIADPFYENIQGTTDSEHVFGYYLTLLSQSDSRDLAATMITLIDHLNSMAVTRNTDLVLNLAVTDGKTVVITRYTNIEKSASLYYASQSKYFPGGIIAASEKLYTDDDSWTEFPLNQQLVIAADGSWSFQALPNPFFVEGILTRKAKPSTLLA
ncbi:MAG: class II glutamine amidotransferase [Bacteroidetes bacterium]|nr:class II glutamine amidotransferase [Bacteroidota bacterium]